MSGRRMTSGQIALALLTILLTTQAHALDFWDGRVEIHGFVESRMSFGWEDFQGSNDIELMQWQQVLNVEVEADLAPDGFGPFDLVSAFARVEVKFDCVWTRACSLSDAANAFGDRPERLPQRVQNGRRDGYQGSQWLGDVRRYAFDDETRLGYGLFGDAITGSRVATNAVFGPTYQLTFRASPGTDGVFGTFEEPGDDARFSVYRSFISDDCLVGTRKVKADTASGFDSTELHWNPGCDVVALGRLRDVPNPFNPDDPNPNVIATDPGTRTALPFRPGTERSVTELAQNKWEPQGIYIPNARLAKLLEDGELDSFDQNFTRNELQWNRGASQQDEKELKEAYLDVEMFDSRLWVRAGKQTIVWGKTELFRNQDQWNPVDIGLGPLASLEEARISLWALRGVWSFYEVGPFEDVRLELIALADSFEPADIGRCGEPFVALKACAKGTLLNAHGVTGSGAAGEIRPPNPWNSWKGWEVGARLEWRWERYSFAVSDYYGFNDSFYTDPVFQYSRNVDPLTGRPRQTMDTGRCRRGNEDACLQPNEALTHHSVNQQLFHWICANTVGIAGSLGDPVACAQTLFNSQVVPAGSPGTLANVFSNILAGQGSFALPVNGNFLLANLGSFNDTTRAQLAKFGTPGVLAPGTGTYQAASLFRPDPVLPFAVDPAGMGFPSPLVPLVPDGTGTELGFGPALPLAFASTALQNYLTPEQAALLGCGPFYGTDCDVDGIDLMNAEASALVQSFPWFEGTWPNDQWDTTAPYAQPGTVGFDGGPTCTIYDQQTGESFILPGCRGPGDPGYNVAQDGSPGGRTHPFTGQDFRSEMSILSWNFLMVAASLSAEPGIKDKAVLDPDKPFAKDRCSFAKPQFCALVAGLNDVTRVSRTTVRAGGNGRYGRRSFTWHTLGDAVLRYEKRNVFGVSMDFAEDVTKTNWGLEFTWQEGLPFADANSFDTHSEADTYNLTISIDRPTFINFLNANRTFFFNSQLFISYIDDYTQGFTADGPWTFLWLINVNTGYYKDRFLVGFRTVWDFRSNSGAFLPELTYRYTENASVIFGAALFAGRWSPVSRGISQLGYGSPDTIGNRAYAENGVSAARDLDNFYFRLRYTF